MLSLGLLAMIGGCFAYLVVRPSFILRRLGPNSFLFDGYMATKDGWLPKRSIIFWSIVSAPLLVLSFLGLIGMGQRVDANGILDAEYLVPRHHAHAEVVSIELYSQIMAPIGLRVVSNLVVRFRDGSRFTYMPEDNRRLPDTQRVATYVSNHAQVPITVGLTRPK
jgi:hypothetical protein